MNSVTVAADRLAPGENPVFHHGERVTCLLNGKAVSDARISISDFKESICQNLSGYWEMKEMFDYKHGWALNENVTRLRHVTKYRTEIPAAFINVPNHVIFNGKATIVFWQDGTKTVTKCSADDTLDPKMGFLMAYFRHYSGMSKTQTAKYLKRICVLEAE